MSYKIEKDDLALMATLIDELMENSDGEENALLHAAIAESLGSNTKVRKTPINEKRPVQSKVDARAARQVAYLRKSRFENVYEPSVMVEKFDNMCPKTLKAISNCICKDHIILESIRDICIVQKGGPSITDIDFKTHWHMSKATVEKIYTLINSPNASSEIEHKDLLLVLWHLVHDEPLDALELRFSVTKDAVHRAKVAVLDRLCSLRPQYELWPVGPASVDLTTEGFQERSGLPGTLAAVSLVHLPCKKPPFHRKSFINFSGSTSISFLLACDHNGSFTYSSYYFEPGGREDVTIFKSSQLNTLPVPEHAYLVGNCDYPKNKHILTPFPGKIKGRQSEFNNMHDNSMKILFSAVASVISRFKQLTCLPMNHSSFVRQAFSACLVLHNICVDSDDCFIEDQQIDLRTIFPQPSKARIADSLAIRKREQVLTELFPAENSEVVIKRLRVNESDNSTLEDVSF